jgi:hypothetical protein
MKPTTRAKPPRPAIDAHLDGVAAEIGADAALLDHGQGRRKSAGAQQRRQHDRILDAETAADLPRTADDRLANDRRAENLAVEHDGERLADIGARDIGKRARSRAVEAEGHDRLAGLLVEAGAGVGQALAADGHAILDRITRTFGIGQNGHAGRRAAIERH